LGKRVFPFTDLAKILGVDRGEIPYEAYRGLTWSDWDGKYWKIGFDTNHYGDDLERWPEEAVWNEANFLLHQAEMTDNPWLLRYWRILYRTPGMYWRLAREKWRTGDLVKLITNELRS
jgi:hypothetical protein